MVDYPLPLREGKIKPYSNGRPRIDWTHPLTKGLEFYCPFGNPGFEVDLVSGKKAFYTAHDVRAVTPWGLAHSNNNALASSSKTVMCFPAGTGTKTSDGAGGGDFTVACACFIPSTLSGVFGPDLFGQFDPTNGIGIWFTTNTGTAQPNGFDPSGNLPSSGPNVYQQYATIAIGRKATSSFGFLNGVQWTAGTMNGTGCWSSATGVYLDIAVDPSNPTATSSSLQSQVFWGGMWNRALTQAEHNLLSTDPYCFLIWPEDELFASYTVPSPSIVPTFPAGGFDYPLPLREGKYKPNSNGTPRIDWTHTLAHGLTFYAFDTGSGVVDLVGGGRGKPDTAVVIPPVFRASPFGRGYLYTTSGCSIIMPITPGVPVSLVAPYAFAIGFYPTAAFSADAVLFAFADTISNNGVYFFFTGTSFFVGDANGSNQVALTLIPPAGSFHTVMGNATASSNMDAYYDGIKNATITNSTNYTHPNPPVQAVFNSAGLTGGNADNYNGFTYYAAFWNRALTAREAALLHTDPYCFLVFPEDELLAPLAFSPTAPVIVPSAPGLLQTRSGPGLGPRSRHVRLLNAPLPVAGAAPIVTGGTLPILGVG